ncbi:jg18125 [Pararge aegeria aegeria]|uniref:Jg18125 protein n=1 Tax=Pararge aegeria aegeria TaxID=348720 RepID=A0A8S4RYR5_9NEOP|nr:jg18125 [Pararge aegeria aegeria]
MTKYYLTGVGMYQAKAAQQRKRLLTSGKVRGKSRNFYLFTDVARNRMLYKRYDVSRRRHLRKSSCETIQVLFGVNY